MSKIWDIALVGPGLSGQTTSLRALARMLNRRMSRGNLAGFQADYLEYEAAELCPSAPGRVRAWHTTRAAFKPTNRDDALRACAGFMLVADSQVARHDANLASLEDLAESLGTTHAGLSAFTGVIQYSKRDLPEVASLEELSRELNLMGWREFATVPMLGQGVREAFAAVTVLITGGVPANRPLQQTGLAHPRKPRG